jgi:hypothetical protein
MQVDGHEIICAKHGEKMVQRPANVQTPEQLFCGDWYDCSEPRCMNSTLIESEALRKQHAELRPKQSA